MHLFIDESGGLGKGERYFVVVGVFVEDTKDADTTIKQILTALKQRNPKYRGLNEIKFSEIELEDRRWALTLATSSLYFEVVYVLISKNDASFKNWLSKKINKKKTTFYLDKRLIESASQFHDLKKVIIDRSHYIKGFEKFLSDSFNNLKITFDESYLKSGLQLADMVANSIFLKYEYKNKELYGLIFDRILYYEFISEKEIKRFRFITDG